MGERADVDQGLGEVGDRAELAEREAEGERAPGRGGRAREGAEEREGDAAEDPGGGGLERRRR